MNYRDLDARFDEREADRVKRNAANKPQARPAADMLAEIMIAYGQRIKSDMPELYEAAMASLKAVA